MCSEENNMVHSMPSDEDPQNLNKICVYMDVNHWQFQENIDIHKHISPGKGILFLSWTENVVHYLLRIKCFFTSHHNSMNDSGFKSVFRIF